jgi:hypothetical protein
MPKSRRRRPRRTTRNLEQPEFADLPFDPWPVVGSLALDPAILVRLLRRHDVDGAPGFDRLAQRLASPAAEVCRQLALEVSDAA